MSSSIPNSRRTGIVKREKRLKEYIDFDQVLAYLNERDGEN